MNLLESHIAKAPQTFLELKAWGAANDVDDVFDAINELLDQGRLERVRRNGEPAVFAVPGASVRNRKSDQPPGPRKTTAPRMVTPRKPPVSTQPTSVPTVAVETTAKPSCLAIQKQVSEQFGVPIAELMGKSRKQDITRARHIAMLITRRRCGISYPEIGRRFGDRDHATVCNGCRKIKGLMQVDAELRGAIDSIEEKVMSRVSA